MVPLSQPYMTTGKTTALTMQTLVGKVMSVFLNPHQFNFNYYFPLSIPENYLSRSPMTSPLWNSTVNSHSHKWCNSVEHSDLPLVLWTPRLPTFQPLSSALPSQVSFTGSIWSSWLINVECPRVGLGPLLPAGLPASTLIPLEAFTILWAQWSCGICHIKLCFVKTLQGFPIAQRLNV